MERYWDVWTEDGDVSDSFRTYKEAEEHAKNRMAEYTTTDVYEHRKVSTISRGPVVVTKHKK